MIVQCKEEDVEKNGYPLTDRLKCNIMTQTSPRTGLGKKYIFYIIKMYFIYLDLFKYP